MNKLLVILIVIVSVGLLVSQSLELGSSDNVRGSIITLEREGTTSFRGEHELETNVGGELRRGEVVRTSEGWATFKYSGATISLAENTEVQLVEPGAIKLIGGRVVTYGEIKIVTPWIDISSTEPVSVINYAWEGRVQILPLGASAIVDNELLGTRDIFLPSQWFEPEQEFVTDLEPFNPKNSAESEFYEWYSSLCEEY